MKELVTLFKTHQGVLNKRARILKGPQLRPNIGSAQTPSTCCQALSLGAEPSGLLRGIHLKPPDKPLLTTRSGDNGSRKSPRQTAHVRRQQSSQNRNSWIYSPSTEFPVQPAETPVKWRCEMFQPHYLAENTSASANASLRLGNKRHAVISPALRACSKN